jgi:hypothetical protein
VICGVLLLVSAGLRIWSVAHTLPDVRLLSDSHVFLDMVSQPILSKAFLAGQRPFVVPLMYKLVGGGVVAICVLQSVISALAWSVLAVQVARSLRRPWVKVTGLGLVLAIGLTMPVMGWDTVVMSESISLSLMVLLVAGAIWLAQGWHWAKMPVVTPIALLWAFSRETNAYVLLMIAVVLFQAALVRPSFRRYLWTAAIFAVFFAANQVSSGMARRWEFSLLNVLGQRILPNTFATAFFRASGMPMTPRLASMAHRWASSDDNAFFNDPDLSEFRQWLRSRGRFTYLQWLVSRPGRSFSEPMADMNEMFGPTCIASFSPAFSGALPQLLEGVISYPREGTIVLWWLAGIAIGVIFGAGIWRSNPFWVIPVAMILLAYPHACLVWHADAMEIARHALQAKVQFQIGLWLLGLLALDHLPAKQTTTPLKRDPVW